VAAAPPDAAAAAAAPPPPPPTACLLRGGIGAALVGCAGVLWVGRQSRAVWGVGGVCNAQGVMGA